MNERTARVRQLASEIAPLLPGGWTAAWEEPVTGAYLTSGDMKIFVSAQTGSGFRPGMVRLIPSVPVDYRNVGIDPGNEVSPIYVGENRSPEIFAKAIQSRIVIAQDYPAKAARQAERIRNYHASEEKARELARELGEILHSQPYQNGDRINANPHGDWSVSADSARLTVTLPAEVALKIARLIMQEMP